MLFMIKIFEGKKGIKKYIQVENEFVCHVEEN